jgi:hypothetical protein
MTLFSAAAISAAAAALASPTKPNQTKPNHGITSFSTKVEFLDKQTANQAPTILCVILAKLRLDDPDIVFADAAGKYISPEAFPKAKADFDEQFSVTLNAGKLTCRFVLEWQVIRGFQYCVNTPF